LKSEFEYSENITFPDSVCRRRERRRDVQGGISLTKANAKRKFNASRPSSLCHGIRRSSFLSRKIKCTRERKRKRENERWRQKKVVASLSRHDVFTFAAWLALINFKLIKMPFQIVLYNAMPYCHILSCKPQMLC